MNQEQRQDGGAQVRMGVTGALALGGEEGWQGGLQAQQGQASQAGPHVGALKDGLVLCVQGTRRGEGRQVWLGAPNWGVDMGPAAQNLV